jgi:hypothetical protein
MANTNGWGDGAANNTIGWGQGANNEIGWGDIHADSWAGLTDITGVPGFDADAQAFITAAAITDPTQQAAINTLVVDLKGYSIWTKMKALYPFVGGTAAQHKFNLKDPRDLDAAYRLVFNGGWTHSSTGALPNGTNAFADSKFNPVSQSSLQNNFFIGAYVRTNSNVGLAYEIGNADDYGIGIKFTGLITRYSNGKRYISICDAYSTNNNETNSQGFYSGGTNNSTSQILYKNGINVLSGTSQQTGFSNFNFYVSAVNTNGAAQGYSNKQIALIFISDGFSSTENSNLNTAIQAFQTALSRNV